jgi:hypothetical protein
VDSKADTNVLEKHAIFMFYQFMVCVYVSFENKIFGQTDAAFQFVHFMPLEQRTCNNVSNNWLPAATNDVPPPPFVAADAIKH